LASRLDPDRCCVRLLFETSLPHDSRALPCSLCPALLAPGWGTDRCPARLAPGWGTDRCCLRLLSLEHLWPRNLPLVLILCPACPSAPRARRTLPYPLCPVRRARVRPHPAHVFVFRVPCERTNVHGRANLAARSLLPIQSARWRTVPPAQP
jgi:hypothetical protein